MSRNHFTLRWLLLPLVAALGCKEAADSRALTTAASSSASANNSVASSAAALSAPEWPRQGQLKYSLELASRMTLQGGLLTDLLLKGNVLIQARSLDKAPAAQASQLWVTFSDVTLSSTQQAAEAEFQLVAEQLKQPFLVAVESGLVTKLWLDGSAVPFTQGLQRTLASALQFAPAKGTGTTWTQEEVDATGRHLAEYTLGAAGSVQKRKQKYLAVTLPRGAQGESDSSKLAAEVVASQGKLQFAEGRLAAVDYDEVVRATPLPNAPMETSTRLALKLTGFEGQAAQGGDWAAQQARLKPVAAAEAMAAGPSQAVLDAARIGKRTFEEVLRALEQSSARDKLPPERVNDIPVSVRERADAEQSVRQSADAYHALTAMVRQRPDTLGKVRKALQRKSPAQQMLFDAVSSAGTAEGQSLLREFVGAGQPSTTRVAAATSLIRVALPEPETVNTLTELLADSELRTHGLYGLGTACRHLREAGQTEAAAAIGERLRTELRDAKSEVMTVQALRALANSGYVAALSDVRPLLTHKNPSLRGSAVEALRLMPLPEVDVIIAERLSTETEDKALLSVLNAVSTRDPGEALSKVLDTVLRTHKSPHVRIEALRVVSVWVEHRPELLATLTYVSEHDDNPRISRLAAARLGELSSQAKATTTP
jgi:hypothetical protein